MTEDMRQALDERRELIEQRADVVLGIALDEKATWTKALGTPPGDPRKALSWRRHARTVAAYRDRYGITDDTPLGTADATTAQKIDAARARSALERAGDITRGSSARAERKVMRREQGRAL